MPGTWLPWRADPRDEHLRHQVVVARPLTPERLAALIDTRRELLEGLGRHPEWAEREAELSGLLKSVLDVGNLRLLRIDRHTSVTVLDKIVKYEAVHRIQGATRSERRPRRIAPTRLFIRRFRRAVDSELHDARLERTFR